MDQNTTKISLRAFQLWQERLGGQAPLDDWLKAEWEITHAIGGKTEWETTQNPDHSFSFEKEGF
jgi:hypothetical protein